MKEQVRIIAGQWRGRKLTFPLVEELRPTPNRVRETLFNWLQNDIVQSHCLDLFAGSGALGFEALSRGASAVTFVEQAREVALSIEHNISLLKADNARLLTMSAQVALKQLSGPFDVVFWDAPFKEDLIPKLWPSLVPLLAKEALVYIEVDKASPPCLPEPWHALKRKVAGGVCYGLYQQQSH